MEIPTSVLTWTPYRASLAGGGLDYPELCRAVPVRVLTGSLDRGMYVLATRVRYDERIRLRCSTNETVETPRQLRHTLAAEVLSRVPPQGGIEIAVTGELPGRSGIGSSAAFAVGLLNALRRLRGETPAREALAEEAADVERTWSEQAAGVQDAWGCALGGVSLLTFDGSARPGIERLPARRQEPSGLEMVWAGGARDAGPVLALQAAARRDAGLVALRRANAEAIIDAWMRDERDVGAVGRLLEEAWSLKLAASRGDRHAHDADAVYSRECVARGQRGKLMGAGGGGFLLVNEAPAAATPPPDPARSRLRVRFSGTGTTLRWMR